MRRNLRPRAQDGQGLRESSLFERQYRAVRNRTLSVDGSPMPPEPGQIQGPKTPGMLIKALKHPLQFRWYVSSMCVFNDQPAELGAQDD